MIKFQAIRKAYKHNGKTVEALKGIDLHIKKGEIFGVVGQSGAGKSTLIRCANLLELPTSGEIYIDNVALTPLTRTQLIKVRHQIGMIFQHFNLLSSRTVSQNIALPLELMNTPKAKIDTRVEELLALTGLKDKAQHFPAQLSGGQKQRVAIARALATQPKILLCDEATSALDPQTTDSILSLLKEINQNLGVTILLITHEMEVVKKICDKVALIQGGILVENNEIGNFFAYPQSEIGKQFVAQSQQFDIPEIIQAKLSDEPAPNKKPLIKLTFHGAETQQPLISELTRQFDVNVNILQAKIEQIKAITLGLMLAEIEGDEQQTQNALQYLHEHTVDVEVLGYV